MKHGGAYSYARDNPQDQERVSLISSWNQNWLKRIYNIIIYDEVTLMDYKIIDNNNTNCFVIPVMYKDVFIESQYFQFIESEELGDVLIIEDHSTNFHFSKNMNFGIQKALDSGYKIITLSTDNIQFSNPLKIVEAYKTIKQFNEAIEFVYVPKYLNGYINKFSITDSSFEYLFFSSVLNRLPIFAFKRWLQFKKNGLSNFFIFRNKAYGFLNIEPFSIFSSSVLEKYRFDENIKNSLEDTDFSFQLYKNNVSVKELDTNIIHKGNSSFSKINKRNLLSGTYNKQDYCNNINYLYKKYYG